MKFKMTITILALAALAACFPAAARANLTAKANHDHIKIDFFYNGSEVSVSGFSDPDVDLLVKIASPEGHQVLKKKGKAGGVLWMNVGEMKFENVPNLYFLQGTKKPEDILSQDELQKYVIGYPALEKHAEVSPVSGEDEKGRWFGEYIKYKEHNRLYFTADGGFKLDDQPAGRHYYMKFAWPFQAAPGDYLVTVYAVKGGKVVEQATANVKVEQVGSVKALADMAKNKGALYGALSILAALLSGFGVGLVFRKGGGAH